MPRFNLLILLLFSGALLAGCDRAQEFSAAPTAAPRSWEGIGDYHRCFLKINREWRATLRVNCFQLEGQLYTHSSRLVPAHEMMTQLLGLGGSWVSVVAEDPDIQLAINGAVHDMTLVRVDDAASRLSILRNRDYDPVPNAIEVYRIRPR